MSEFNDTILGKGYIFPIELNLSGRPDIKSDIALIRASIISILSWPYGTRFFLGEYGSKLRELLEDPNDAIMFNLVKHFIVEAITRWETRITALEVPRIEQRDNRIDIHINYVVIKTLQTDTFVYPFYNNIKY